MMGGFSVTITPYTFMSKVGEPKYWSEEDNDVLLGVEHDPEPIPVASLLGTYNWVFENTDFGAGELDGADGRLILINNFKPGAEPTVENLCGDIQLLTIDGKFEGVNAAGAPNCWEIKEVKWRDSEVEDEVGGHEHGLIAYKTLDDNGNRFIRFVWDQGYSGCCQRNAFFLAKKQSPEGTLAYLTEAERARLGMGVEEVDVARKAGVSVEDPEVKEEEAEASGSGKRKAKSDDEGEDRKRAPKALKAE